MWWDVVVVVVGSIVIVIVVASTLVVVVVVILAGIGKRKDEDPTGLILVHVIYTKIYQYNARVSNRGTTRRDSFILFSRLDKNICIHYLPAYQRSLFDDLQIPQYIQ